MPDGSGVTVRHSRVRVADRLELAALGKEALRVVIDCVSAIGNVVLHCVRVLVE